MDVNVKTSGGDTACAGNCEADYDGTGDAGGTIVKGAEMKKRNGTGVTGDGSATPWGPA